MPLPDTKTPIEDRMKARRLADDEQQYVAAQRAALVDAATAHQRLALAAQIAALESQRDQLDGAPPREADLAGSIAQRRAQLAAQSAQLDLEETLLRLGERYGIVDPTHRILADGRLQR